MIFVECFHHTKYTRFMILSCLSECQNIVVKLMMTTLCVLTSTHAAKFHTTKNR